MAAVSTSLSLRREQLVAVTMLAVLFGYVLNIDTTGDCQFGPRYLLPAMPFAALGLVGFTYNSASAVQCVIVASAAAVGLFSFVVNLSGAAYGAMFCNLGLCVHRVRQFSITRGLLDVPARSVFGASIRSFVRRLWHCMVPDTRQSEPRRGRLE